MSITRWLTYLNNICYDNIMKKDYLAHQDCLAHMQALADQSVDLIVADPPYFQVCGHFDFGVWKDAKEYVEWSKAWLTEAKRILKEDGTLMLWGSVGKREITFARLAIMIEDENLFHRQNWITQRNTRGIGAQTNYMSAREDLLFLTKHIKNYTFNIPYTDEKSERKDLGKNGKPRKNTHKRVSNVWSDITEASQSSKERCDHPTVKAQKLCDRIILSHSNPGDIVYIPFAGSGSEIISAINHNRHYIASELDATYIALIKKRVKDFTKNDICIENSNTTEES